MKDKNTFIVVLVSIAAVFGILYANSSQDKNDPTKTETSQNTNATSSPTTQSSDNTAPIPVGQ